MITVGSAGSVAYIDGQAGGGKVWIGFWIGLSTFDPEGKAGFAAIESVTVAPNVLKGSVLGRTGGLVTNTKSPLSGGSDSPAQ